MKHDNKPLREMKNKISLTWLYELIQHLVDNNFYGRIEVVMEAGKIVHCVKHESIKPDS